METAVGSWVPVQILVGMLSALLLAVWALLSWRIKDLLGEVKALHTQVTAMDKANAEYATRAMLGSFGDRFDGRLTTVQQDIGGIKAEMAGLKALVGR